MENIRTFPFVLVGWLVTRTTALVQLNLSMDFSMRIHEFRAEVFFLKCAVKKQKHVDTSIQKHFEDLNFLRCIKTWKIFGCSFF